MFSLVENKPALLKTWSEDLDLLVKSGEVEKRDTCCVPEND